MTFDTGSEFISEFEPHFKNYFEHSSTFVDGVGVIDLEAQNEPPEIKMVANSESKDLSQPLKSGGNDPSSGVKGATSAPPGLEKMLEKELEAGQLPVFDSL